MKRTHLLLTAWITWASLAQAQSDSLQGQQSNATNGSPSDSISIISALTTTPDSTQGRGNTSLSQPDSSTASSQVLTSSDSTLTASASSAPAPTNAAKQARSLQKANMLYSQKAYGEAIPYYEKARLSQINKPMVLSNLGDCYRLTSNATGAASAYGELVESGNAEPIQKLYYGQALMQLGETDKAKPYLEAYTADDRGNELSKSIEKLNTFSKNADAYSVNIASYNSTANDYCAVKFYDAIVFTSARSAKSTWVRNEQGWTNGAFMDIYATSKDAANNNLPPSRFMGDLNSKLNDGPVSFSKDFSVVYFTRNNHGKSERATDGTYKLQILEATLDQNGFTMVTRMPFMKKDFNYAHPSISANGLDLYFASDMPGGSGGMDIYVCHKDSSGIWGEPKNLGPKVNTPGVEAFPYVAPNDVLYFSSDGHEGIGGLDIYEAKRRDGEVTKIYNMGEPVNSRYDDFGYYLAEDLKSGFLSSNRKSGGMDDDIYELTVLRDVRRGKEVTLITKDLLSGEIIDSVKVVINGDTLITNEKGELVTSAEDGVDYKVETAKTDYFKTETSFNSNESDLETFTKDVLIEKDPKLFLRALITDAKTGDLIEGATIRVTDIATNTELDLYTTTASGDYFKFLFDNRIGDKLAYLIRIDKPGYLQRTAVFTHEIDQPGEINLNQFLNLSLGKVAVGMDLAKMIDMKPIYFDMGKASIRPDAALELDKIVQVMNEYPNMIIELGSHTDCRSSAASNLKLSTQRAKASANYIVKKGISASRITGKGYGETRLLNNCACEGKTQSSCPEEEHARNRRTEFIITKLK